MQSNPYLNIPNYNTDGSWQSRFLGFPAMQNRNAAPCWSYLMELHRPARIIELGTYEGGFSVLLAFAARNYNVPFWTYDMTEHPQHVEWLTLLGANQVKNDIFSPETSEQLRALIAEPGTTYLLCDNGCKEKEWRTFAPSLKPGDIIGAHDYCLSADYWVCAEFYPEHVADCSVGLTQITSPNFEMAAWYVCRRT